MADKKREPDFVLPDGTEIVFDFYKITRREYASIFSREQTDEEEAAVMAKPAGIDPNVLMDLPLPVWRKFAEVFFKRASDPIDEDPKN